ncbi:pyridoxal 5'-phosphate synthase-like subunit PDX1.2 [Tanacetum coccineum]
MVLSNTNEDEVLDFAKEVGVPYDILVQPKQIGRLLVVHFASGGFVTPADATLMMQLGCDGVFAVRNHKDAKILAKVSSGLSDMGASGMELNEINELNDAMNGVNN